MEENNNKSQKKLIELLTELAAVQADNMKLTFAIKVREAREAVKAKMASVKKSIVEKAKGYGFKARKLALDYVEGKNGAKAVQELEETIIESERQYEENLKNMSDEIASLEVDENDAVFKLYVLEEAKASLEKDMSEIMQKESEVTQEKAPIIQMFEDALVSKDDTKLRSAAEAFMSTRQDSMKYKQQREEIQQKIARFEEGIERLEANLKKIQTDLKNAKDKQEEYSREGLIDILMLEEEKETLQDMIPQQNRWQRMLGAFFNKINGANKFTRDVIGKVKQETMRITTEEIPKMKSKTKEKATKTIGQVVAIARDAKYATIARAEQRLEAKKERNEELTHKRNAQLGVEQVEEEEPSV